MGRYDYTSKYKYFVLRKKGFMGIAKPTAKRLQPKQEIWYRKTLKSRMVAPLKKKIR